MLDLTLEQIFVYSVAGIIGAYISIKTIRDREKGKTDTYQKVPIVGAFSTTDYWWPKDNKGKNILLGKLYVFFLVFFSAYIDRYKIFLLIFALVAVLYHINWFSEDE